MRVAGHKPSLDRARQQFRSFRSSFNRALLNLEKAGKIKRATVKHDGVTFPGWRRADLAKTLRQVAYHEAGHAVIGHVLKRGVEFATIESRRESLGHVKHTGGKRFDFISDILLLMAGEVASAEFSKRPVDWKGDGVASDVKHIRRRRYWGEVEESWITLEKKTQILVLKHWRAIEATAAALLKSKTLLRSEIANLCRDNGSDFEKL
jgi:hypothetical protein